MKKKVTMYTKTCKPIVATGKELNMMTDDVVIKHENGIIHYGTKFDPIKIDDDVFDTFSVRFTHDDAVVITMRKNELFHLKYENLLCIYEIDIQYFANNRYVLWRMSKDEYDDFSEHLEFLPDFQTFLDVAFSNKKLDGKKHILKSLKHVLEYYRHTKKYAYKTPKEMYTMPPEVWAFIS